MFNDQQKQQQQQHGQQQHEVQQQQQHLQGQQFVVHLFHQRAELSCLECGPKSPSPRPRPRPSHFCLLATMRRL
ncbi:GL13633 [Drosophila persimilis]|uniref:GL13633 n=1 Tax=Drosophila persimilis TaxID=7234 RepID=B4GPC3_DROPE|nr:GL13633 [Drosophila persimilis]